MASYNFKQLLMLLVMVAPAFTSVIASGRAGTIDSTSRHYAYKSVEVNNTSYLSYAATRKTSIQAVNASMLQVDNDKAINSVKVFYNPIAEHITASFKLTKGASVSIKVMDALGNEVLNLMNGRLEAGVQNLSFETNGKLTAGFYFVSVSSGAEKIVKRVSIR